MLPLFDSRLFYVFCSVYAELGLDNAGASRLIIRRKIDGAG